MHLRWKCAAIAELDSAVARVVPQVPVALSGQWSSSKRRTYESDQFRRSVGPFVEVVDWVWTGSLVGAAPIAALALLATPTGVHWVKSAPTTPGQPVRISLHAYANDSPGLATLGAAIGNECLPSVSVAYADSPEVTCAVGDSPIVTGRVSLLARADRADALVLLIQAGLFRIGRNRLWRLCDRYAAVLSPQARAVLTRRRTGCMGVDGGAA